MKADILIVDDSKDMLEVISRQLEAKGFNSFKATNVMDAVDLLKLKIPNLLITDIQMPGVDGGKLVKYVQNKFPELPILVVTGYPSIPAAAEVLKDGSVDYLTKPFTQSELITAVTKLLSHETESDILEDSSQQAVAMIGKAKSLSQVYHLIERTKNNKVTVLITGESGTGKELVARAIHYDGNLSGKPFIAVNCGAIPANLLEAELFGFEKGAFTGATVARDGLFMAANGGTLFLDEIGNAPAQVQQSLLRAIQEKEIYPVGGRKAKSIDLRIVAATNNNLLEMVEKGSFREDLYYRLAVVNIKLPPLRNRVSDIPSLVQHFVIKHGKELGKSNVAIESEFIEELQVYHWPGNIRELENVVQQALVLSDKSLSTALLSQLVSKTRLPITSENEPQLALKSLKEVELAHIKKVLEHCANNKTKAAEILGITRKTLAQKLQ